LQQKISKQKIKKHTAYKMEISTKYDPTLSENKWYKYWMDKKYFHSTPDHREPYTIVIPPPNVTGVLHMGHMLNNTIQDVLIRRARMQGKNACWIPGTDHASIATETKVINMLKEKGIEKKDISREEFLKHAWQWKEKHGGIILEQLKKLGASCDWDRTKFTMDDDLSESVIKVFCDLYEKGQIYKGIRMVNWDPVGKTAVSDEEVNHKEVNSKLYYIKYLVDGSDDFLVVATTRPETIPGDTAVCVNPNDERYQHLAGKEVIVPIINKKVKVIFDEYVDKDFGTGVLKVTPAHDINDYELGLRHHLEVIDVLNSDGTMSEAAQVFVGEDRFKARKLIVKAIEEADLLVKAEEIKNKVGFSERTDAVIEPRISQQWFLKMDELAKPALENVMNDKIKFLPEKFKNSYKNWMSDVHDWCISRQLWWGHQIPAYYLEDGSTIVAPSPELALEKAKAKTGNNNLSIKDLKQDADVLDTWFSSWLWPIAVFNGINEPDNKEINYYYPTNDLVTAPEILFFWVARMIMAGYEYRGDLPFRNVYLTGIVRDKLGRKMSKSLGNSPDPIELIEKHGADGVRVGMLLSSPAGNDLPFDESLCEQGRNFSNKLWNAFRLVQGWERSNEKSPEYALNAIQWFEAKFNEQLAEIEENFEKYRISDALMTSYKLVWDDFCAWYLEIIKPAYGSPIDQNTYDKTVDFFERILKVLHPFMPFITEELWHTIKERPKGDDIIIAKIPKSENFDAQIISDFDIAKEVISGIRNIRNERNIPIKNMLSLCIKENQNSNKSFDTSIIKLSGLDSLTYINEKLENAFSFVVKSNEYYIPSDGLIDAEEEKLKLSKELVYLEGFLDSVMKKLSNERFVQNAKPEVVQIEVNKKEDAENKINIIKEKLAKI
jgi:valyl-tRNA synthetase